MKYGYWYYKNILNKKRIKEINKFIKNNFDIKESEKDGAKSQNFERKKFLNTKQIVWKKIKNYLIDIDQLVTQTNQSNFGYSLYPVNDYDYINHNTYTVKNGKYDWHIDNTDNPFMDIKLTAILNLSEKKYENGKFFLFAQEEIEVKEFNEPGDLLIFKSDLNHKVSQITQGERISLSIFYKGPLFK